MPFRSAVPVLLFVFLACSAAAAAETVSGTATFQQRLALPAGAVFEARVVDVSRADAPAAVVGSTRIDNPGNPPIAFAIDVDPAKIDQRHRYAVRATIRADGRLMFTTDTVYSVLTQGAGRDVALQLVAAASVGPALKARPAEAAALAPLAPFPVSYTGDLPCADCAALRYRLNLFADRSYFLGTEYVGRNAQFYDIGNWGLSSDGSTLRLQGGRDAPTTFRVVDARTLRLLAMDGSEIQSPHNHSLLRTTAFEPLQPRLKLRGMVRYMADAAVFTECTTGQRWPVAQAGDNAALQAEYLKLRSEPGAELLVNVEGRVSDLPRAEGKGTQRTLVVERFVGATPRETCGPRGATSGLLDTYWVLTQIEGDAVTVAANQREPSLVLHSAQQRVAGFSGCNRLNGSYSLNGAKLAFGQMLGTMMACTEGMELEKQFLDALPRVATYAITGVHLELKDAAGTVLARFEARPLR